MTGNDVPREEQGQVVEEPPYRMVPGDSSVCTWAVLRRFDSMKLTPSGSQKRKGKIHRDGNDYTRRIIELFTRHTEESIINAPYGKPGSGIRVKWVGKLKEYHVRWYGPVADEDERLTLLAHVLRQKGGFTVKFAEENNVDWPMTHPRNHIVQRRNRKFLRVAKFQGQT